MTKFWEYFENLNEYVYVSDVETYEIVYINKKLRDDFGISSNDQLAGKKCYQFFQKNHKPCAMCNNKNLVPGFFNEWEYCNAELNKYFILKDTLVIENGRKLRVEIAIDDTVRNLKMNLLNDYQSLESRANEGFKQALRADTPEKSINIILEYLGKSLKGERTYIIEKNENGNDDNTYEWCANGITPQIQNLQDLPPNVCANWYSDFKEDKSIIIKDIDELKVINPLQYEILSKQNITSFVIVPLFDDFKVIGFFGIDNPPKENLDYVEGMLQITGHFIVSALKRRNLAAELKFMAHKDQLTRLGNRYAMNEFIQSFNNSLCTNFGIIFCDITGLKKVNDTQGHSKGDELILSASNCLKKVFGNYGVFRIGGDELLVLCPKIAQNDFDNKVSELKEEIQKNSVVLAMGIVWKKTVDVDFEELFKESEKLMYEDKSAYYKRMGIDRRII